MGSHYFLGHPRSSWTTTELPILLTFCLTAITVHQFMKGTVKLFWLIKNSDGILNKLKSKGFLASSLSTYDFSALYTTWPHNLMKGFLASSLSRYDSSTIYTTLAHNLIKGKLMETFNRESSLYLACNENRAFSLLNNINNISCVIVRKSVMLDNIVIRFGSKLYRQIVGYPMGTSCAPLVADLFLFCYERDFMLSLSDN